MEVMVESVMFLNKKSRMCLDKANESTPYNDIHKQLPITTQRVSIRVHSFYHHPTLMGVRVESVRF